MLSLSFKLCRLRCCGVGIVWDRSWVIRRNHPLMLPIDVKIWLLVPWSFFGVFFLLRVTSSLRLIFGSLSSREVVVREALVKRVVMSVFYCWYAWLIRRHTSVVLGINMSVVVVFVVLVVVYKSRVRTSRLLSMVWGVMRGWCTVGLSCAALNVLNINACWCEALVVTPIAKSLYPTG